MFAAHYVGMVTTEIKTSITVNLISCCAYSLKNQIIYLCCQMKCNPKTESEKKQSKTKGYINLLFSFQMLIVIGIWGQVFYIDTSLEDATNRVVTIDIDNGNTYYEKDNYFGSESWEICSPNANYSNYCESVYCRDSNDGTYIECSDSQWNDCDYLRVDIDTCETLFCNKNTHSWTATICYGQCVLG